MTRLARDAAAAQAASEEALASPTSAIAVWDQVRHVVGHARASWHSPPTACVLLQIPGQLLTKLVRQGYTLVDDFLGSDWVPLVRADLLRLHKQGKLKPATGSVNDFLRRAGHGPATATAQAAAAATAAAKGPANANNSNSDSSRTATAVPLTCAVDLSHTADFPALGELLERLLALPFELNRKARLKLGVPLQGSLHVTCLPAGASRCDTQAVLCPHHYITHMLCPTAPGRCVATTQVVPRRMASSCQLTTLCHRRSGSVRSMVARCSCCLTTRLAQQQPPWSPSLIDWCSSPPDKLLTAWRL